MYNFKPKSEAALVAILLLAVLVVLFVPIIFIWSLNTLFPVLAIPYTFETWLAALILPALLKTTINKKD